MKDPQLTFWTTKPNKFIVAKTPDNTILGCIAYQEINPDTVEMMRLSVDSKYRSQKVGLKLVEELIQLAKNEEYQVMYLQTRNSLVHARNLYEKLGFKLLKTKKFSPRTLGNCGNIFSGLFVCAYVKRL